jgi:hypothetical protein
VIRYPAVVDPYVNILEDFYDPARADSGPNDGGYAWNVGGWWSGMNGDWNYAAYPDSLQLSAKPVGALRTGKLGRVGVVVSEECVHLSV